MPEFLREHTGPMVFSVLLHGALVAALVLTAVVSTTRAPVYLQSAPVNATVIDSQILHAAERAQAERAAEQARAAAQAAADAKAADEAKAAQQVKAAADAKAADEAKAASAAKAAADAKAAEEARADAARAAEDAKRQAEAKRAADEKRAAEAKAAADAKQAAEAKRAADERARKEREDELRRQMADEEHTAAVEASPLKDRYVALLRDRIQNAWIKPPSARVGVDCVVQVTQVPGGEVTSARVTQCNGDAAVRQSIENAVYRASPLPDPPDPALFQRNFAFEFKPNE
ncbi:MAG: cell envelope integrity protein TolA [Steroidobacteraceae bacterium]